MAQRNEEKFQRALTRFKQSLTPDLAKEFSISSLADVKQVCTEIQQKHGCDGKLRYMGRLRGFIEAMEQFGKVIEVFLNTSEILCFLWGPMKFLLITASTHINSFDKLLDAYVQVGNAIPGLQRYEATFAEHPPLATVLEDYYSDILEFHRISLAIFKRPRWKDMYHSVWKTFDSNLSPILHSLGKRRELLESEKSSAVLYEIQRLRKDHSVLQTEYRQQIDEERLHKHKTQIAKIRERLDAPNYEIDQEMAAENTLIDDSGKWLFESNEFQTWYTDGSGHRILYLNGIPGAGKTTLVSAVVRKLLDERNPATINHSIVYFYFKHLQPTKQSHNSLLRSVLDQLISQDSTILDHLFNRILAIDPTSLRLTKTLEGFVKEALGSHQATYIVIDGLDESAPKEAARSVEWLLSLLKGSSDTTTTTSLRVLFSGQRDGILDNLLADEPSITLENTDHAEDIKSYCSYICERIGKKFNISQQLQEEICHRVAEGAKGMFLYARVVLDNLLSQTRLSSLKAEIQPGTFPEGIEKAYERVAARVFKESSSSEREDAKKILGWITCAGRLLRWREIQSNFCIAPKKGVVEYEEGKLRVTCKELCSSLVDVHSGGDKGDNPDDIVKIVHETAREYLIRNSWIDVNHAHATLALFCSTYLTSDPFQCNCDEKTIYDNAVAGYYALQDYAVQYWFYHLNECIKLSRTLDIALWKEVVSSARDFLGSYGTFVDTGKHDTGDNEGVINALNNLPQDDMERNTHFNIELRTIRIRKVLESVKSENLEGMTREILKNLHGPTKIYKCSKPWCELFTTGYEEIEDCKLHLNRHDLPFCCTFEECPAHSVGFDTLSKLNQHVGSYHQEASNELEFPKVRSKKDPTFHQAIIQGDITAIQTMLHSGMSINHPRAWKYQNGGSLHTAIEYGQIEVCKLLLENGADINYRLGDHGRTPLHTAVKSERLEIVHLLLRQEQCLPDKYDKAGVSPFQYACREGNLAIAKMLFETGKIDVEKSRAIRSAIERGHFRVVQYLLAETQVGPVTKDDLLAAVMCGHKSIANMLLPAIASSPQGRVLGNPYMTGFPPNCVRLESDWLVIYNQYAPHRLPRLDLVYTFCVPEDILKIVFSYCFKYVVFGIGEDVLQIYDIVSMKQVGQCEADMFPTKAFLSSDGRRLVAKVMTNEAYVWDIINGSPDAKLQLGSFVMSVYFAGDGRTLIAHVGHGIHVMKVENGHLYHERTIAVKAPPTVLVFSPDGRYIVAGTTDGTICVWETASGNFLERFAVTEAVPNSIENIWFIQNNENIMICRTSVHIQLYELSGSNTGRGIQAMKKVDGSSWIINLGGRTYFKPKNIWRISDLDELRHGSLTYFAQQCRPLTFDFNWLLSSFEGHSVEFVDAHNSMSRLVLQLPKDEKNSIMVSPTQPLFITYSRRKLRLWSYTSESGRLHQPSEQIS
ncbi:WD40 repeat-like protein [Daldinia caldariorum]|uniref:WD40 repeat-like protein n=1 Tax=Daldinia caldariorum TaxID=326644 RepID=UPI002008BAA0|nr:WD40 repeat-like protein [Daldinia caldariorum]KAI1467938.1 WD40 repeat-like protein [Daldinia caldariorum]